MKRFLTRFFAVLLSICVAASVLTVSAAAVAEAAFYTLGSLILGYLISYSSSEAADVIGQGLGDFGENVQDFKGRLNAVNFTENSVVCRYQEWDNSYYFYVNDSGLSESDQEIAQFICDYYNENFEEYNYSAKQALYYGDKGDHVSMEAKFYEKLKTGCYNALNSYVAKESHEARTGQKIESFTELHDILGDSVPKYDFSFTGPNPTLSFTSPEFSKVSVLLKDGFTFTPAASFTPGQTALTDGQLDFLVSCAPDFITKGNGYLRTTQLTDRHYSLYAFNYYFMTDDGNLYFSSYSSYNADGDLASYSYPLSAATSGFYDVTGKFYSGKDAAEIKSRITSVGVVLNTGNQVPSSVPLNFSGSLNDEDFKTTSGGVEIVNGIPRTGIENILGGAISTGLIAADAPLTIGADGSIIAADGIPIDKLGEILEALQSGNLNLDSIADYLSLISTLVGNGNLTMTEQQKILENVNANTKAGAKDLAQIRAAIDELTKEYEWEAEDESADGEISWITAEHTGFAEAQQLTDEIEAVSQSKKLLNNLFNKFNTAENRAPSFSFYWDSDKDGTTEKYTVLDLSFMEQKLTNANLEDKRRFRSGNMTVRSFVQFLILLVSYTSFAIKIIKRIPSLINGAGSSDSDIHTVSKEK